MQSFFRLHLLRAPQRGSRITAMKDLLNKWLGGGGKRIPLLSLRSRI
jgi:hypothetical protein